MLSIGAVYARLMRNLWTTCFFIAPMQVAYGLFYYDCLVFLG